MAKKSITADVPFAIPEWPATRVEMWPLNKIKPYPNNPRTHPQEQIDALAASMANDGVTMPILVDEAGEIIAGHGRRLAAEKSGFREYPVVIARGWTDTQKRAARLRDNQLGLLSEWDDALLRMEIGELKMAEFDLPMLGFSDDQLSKLTTDIAPVSEDRELTEDEQEVVNKAWRVLVKDWLANAERSLETGFVSTNYTRGALMVHFTRSLFHGDDIPRGVTTAYNPHRIFKSTSNKPFIDVFKKAISDDSVLRGIQFVISGRPLFDSIISGTLGIHGYRLAGDFPALLARNLINEHTPKGGSVLDPCHGWGGRMLGFMLSDAGRYHGYDTDEQTVQGVSEMFADLRLLRPEKKAKLICQPFEDARLAPKSFDFALTSPPYYDTEQYGGELSSWKRYGTFDDWVGGFFKPLIEKTAGAIKAGGVFALQIGNQSYPLEARAREITNGCEFTFVEKRTTDMVNNYTGTDAQEGEIVLILRKSGRAIKVAAPTETAKKLNGNSDMVPVKVSAKCARIMFTECGPACISQNGCKGNCCKSPGKPGGCFVTVHPDEQARVEAAGAVVRDGMIVPPAGTTGCPFHKDGLCVLFGQPARPFGCIASPFTLNKKGTLIIRNRYTVLPCHLGKGDKKPAYKTFRTSLDLMFSREEVERISAHLDAGGGDMTASMSRAIYDKLIHNDAIKRQAKKKMGDPLGPPMHA